MRYLAVFDFDGTLADLHDLHKNAWQQVIDEIGLVGGFCKLFPPEKYLLERFDSRNRIGTIFFSGVVNVRAIERYFKISVKEALIDAILDLKEKYLLDMLHGMSPSKMNDYYTKNIFQAIDGVIAKQYKLGIIASERESVMLAVLGKCKLDQYFSFIIGDESMYDIKNGELEVEDIAVRDKIPKRITKGLDGTPSYIGADVRIDSHLAHNYGFNFIESSKKCGLLRAVECL